MALRESSPARLGRVIEGPKRFPKGEVKFPLPYDAQEINRLNDASDNWLGHWLKGVEAPRFEETVEFAIDKQVDRLQKLFKDTADLFGAFIVPDIAAFVAQRFHFKPKERKAMMQSMLAETAASEQVRTIEAAINRSEHLTPEEGTDLLERIWKLTDAELAAIPVDELKKAGMEQTLEMEAAEASLSQETVAKIEELLERHVRSRIDGRRVLLDAVVTALVVAGVAKIETLPEEKVLVSLVRKAITVKAAKTAVVAAKGAYYGVKGYKGFVVLKEDLKAIRAKWKHVTASTHSGSVLANPR